MTALQVRCRFMAAWDEGRLGFGTNPAKDATGDPLPPEAVPIPWRDYAEAQADNPALLRTIKAARDAGLPSMYDPRGMSFPERLPLLIEHAGAVVGTVYSIKPDGLEFVVQGFADPEHYAALSVRPYVSPGLSIEAAEVIDGPDGPVLFVTSAAVVELSATATPSRDGTMLLVSPPAPVPESERFALEPAERFRIEGFPGSVTVG